MHYASRISGNSHDNQTLTLSRQGTDFPFLVIEGSTVNPHSKKESQEYTSKSSALIHGGGGSGYETWYGCQCMYPGEIVSAGRCQGLGYSLIEKFDFRLH